MPTMITVPAINTESLKGKFMKAPFLFWRGSGLS